ncbi:MAG: putative Ig domain-containing protein [Phycisphaerae bacterium]
MSSRGRSVLVGRAALFILFVLAAPALGDIAGISPGQHLGSDPFTTRAPGPGEIAVTGPMFITSPGYYILTQDITAAGSAIGINSANVTLDLNGHTITFGTGVINATGITTYNSLQSGNVGHWGVVCTNDKRDTADFAFGWNAKYAGVVVKNGRILQGSGTGLAYSNGVGLTGTMGAQVEDLIVGVSAPDSSNIILGTNSLLHNTTLTSTGTIVSNRHAELGQVVMGPGAQAWDNILDGSPQSGFKAAGTVVIHDNLIKTRAAVTNGYAIIGWKTPGVTAYNNDIVAYNGRGIHLSEGSSGWNVYDNYVEVRETGDAEYSTMQTHGIKFDAPPTSNNHSVHDNVVVSVSSTKVSGATTFHGQPTPLNLGYSSTANIRVYNNSFVAQNIGGEPAWSLYLIGEDGSTSQISDQSFYTNVYSVGVAWDGASNNTIRRCDFRKIAPTDSVTFYQSMNGTGTSLASQNNRFIDCAYYGINPRSYSFYGPGAAADYSIGWSLGLRATYGASVLAGASVTVRDSLGSLVASGSTDGAGRFSADLMEFKASHAAGSYSTVQTVYGPYTVLVSGSGQSRQFAVNARAPMDGDVDLTGAGLLVLTPSTLKPAEARRDYYFGLTASGTAAATWSLTDGALPAGLAITGSAISGRPTQTGTFSFDLSALAGGLTAAKEFTLTVTPYQAVIRTPGDANLDGIVDMADYVAWFDGFGSGAAWQEGDFNHDGMVDMADYVLWFSHYGQDDTGTVPEPATLALVLAGALMIWRRRRWRRSTE